MDSVSIGYGNGNQSPVFRAFPHIRWEWTSLHKLRLSDVDVSILRSTDEKPLEYTLSDGNDAVVYVKVLLKLLGESVGTAGPSEHVSRTSSLNSSSTVSLEEDEACIMLEKDPMGVVTHYSITRLWEVINLLHNSKSKKVSIFSTFFVIAEDGSFVLADEWRPLLRVLHLGGYGDPFAQRGASMCLSMILLGCNQLSASINEPLLALISWIASQLQSASARSLLVVTSSLLFLMKSSHARVLFAESGGIGYIARHLRSASKTSKKTSTSTVQQIYELCFCLWTLTFECNSSNDIRTHFARDGAINALVELVSASPREKIVRVTLSALRNLAVCTSNFTSDGILIKKIDGSFFLTEMIACGLMKVVENQRGRQWTDPDIVDDLDILYIKLKENYRDMSRWDVYEGEVESGHLSWGVVHTENFIRENISSFEGKNGDFAILKVLISLLAHHDDDVKAIACFDIGEFARHYPNGRSITKRLGAKDFVMSLIEHENSDVQQQALSCISKIMVQNWEYVN